MKSLKIGLSNLLLVMSLMLPWATAEALDTFEEAGIITSLKHDSFTVYNQKYRISPDARLQSTDPSRKKFSDFKAGDKILFKGKILSGVYYVDVIYYYTPTPS